MRSILTSIVVSLTMLVVVWFTLIMGDKPFAVAAYVLFMSWATAGMVQCIWSFPRSMK